MTIDIRWFAPLAALAAATPQCIAAQYMSVDQARGLIFDKAQEFVPSSIELTPDQLQQLEHESGVKSRTPKQAIWRAMVGGKMLGWFIIDQVIGKHELITYAVGLNLDGTLKQMQVIDYKEAWGYQVRELKWRDQFVGKSTTDALKIGTDIGNISGGTLSANSMTNGMKRLLFLHRLVLRNTP